MTLINTKQASTPVKKAMQLVSHLKGVGKIHSRKGARRSLQSLRKLEQVGLLVLVCRGGGYRCHVGLPVLRGPVNVPIVITRVAAELSDRWDELA